MIYCRKTVRFFRSKKTCVFTLIELLVNISISSLCFFKRSDKLELQNTPLFLKEKGGAGERGNFFSREKKFPLSPAHTSFTLIELLVVIAIIAILAAILLPALQKARIRGSSTSCVSNEKQFGTAIQQYMDMYEGYFPVSLSSSKGYWWYSMRLIFPSYKLSKAGSPSVKGDTRAERVKNAPLFFCPQIFINPYNSSSTGEIFYIPPKWSRFGCGDYQTPKYTKIKKPAQKFMLLEHGFDGGGSVAMLPGHSNNVFAHSKNMNILHWDGHVGAYPRQFPYFELSGNLNNFSKCDYHWHPYYDNRSKKQ